MAPRISRFFPLDTPDTASYSVGHTDCLTCSPRARMGEPKDTGVSEAMLAVLQVLWDRGPSTVRAITDVLYPGGGDSSYATVQTLLRRLEGKKHVTRDRSGHAHLFYALTGRDGFVGARLRQMAEDLCGGMMGPLLTHLVRAEALTAQERQQLRALIDELDRSNRSRH